MRRTPGAFGLPTTGLHEAARVTPSAGGLVTRHGDAGRGGAAVGRRDRHGDGSAGRGTGVGSGVFLIFFFAPSAVPPTRPTTRVNAVHVATMAIVIACRRAGRRTVTSA